MSMLLQMPSASADLTHYNPDKGLKTIATASAAERFWAQAKDTTQLLQAIKAKLYAQAEYVVWRDSIVVPSQKTGAPGRGKRISGLQPVLPDADPGHVVAHRWRKRLCVKINGSTRIDPSKMARELSRAQARCVQICEGSKPAHGAQGTGVFERYTPAQYIEAARLVLGGRIGCDPASNVVAQQNVQADTFYRLADNGLAHPWHGCTWLNGPYDDLLPWVQKLLAEIEVGHVPSAIMLTNGYTDTKWFSLALQSCASACFTLGRIRFLDASGERLATPPHGQVFFYFGRDVELFEDEFSKFGNCVRLRRRMRVKNSLLQPARTGAWPGGARTVLRFWPFIALQHLNIPPRQFGILSDFAAYLERLAF